MNKEALVLSVLVVSVLWLHNTPALAIGITAITYLLLKHEENKERKHEAI